MNEDEIQPLSTTITIKEEEKSKSLTQPIQTIPFYSTQAEAELIHTECESVENAVAFIVNNMNAIYHRFNTGGNINNINNNTNKQKSLESINKLNSIDENININHEHKTLKIC